MSRLCCVIRSVVPVLIANLYIQLQNHIAQSPNYLRNECRRQIVKTNQGVMPKFRDQDFRDLHHQSFASSPYYLGEQMKSALTFRPWLAVWTLPFRNRFETPNIKAKILG